jgi:hypothetical protein
MICPTCRTPNSDAAAFCVGCGTALNTPVGFPAVPTGGQGMAIAALILGVLGLGGACLPILGLPLNIIGLILGIKALKSAGRGMAISGVVLCSIGLLLTIVNAAVGVYLAVTGQHQLVNILRQGSP